MPYICKEPDKSLEGTFVDDGYGGYKGECVSLVKKMCPGMPATRDWKRGKLVKGDMGVAKGTAIATFKADGKYKSGDGHAAIYISQDATGLLVWDQYNHPKKGVGQRQLKFGGKGDSNDGDKFYVIE